MHCIMFNSHGNNFCAGHDNGYVRLWNAHSGTWLSGLIHGHRIAVRSVSLSWSMNTILKSGDDDVHKLMDTRTFEVWGEIEGKNDYSRDKSCISPDDFSYANLA